MSISKKRGIRKKPLIAWNSSSTCSGASTPNTIIIGLMLLTGSLVLIITPTLMTTALAQEEVVNATTGAATTTTDTITDASSPPPGTELSSQPDQNFSEFPEFDDFSQTEDFSPFSSSSSSFMTDVNGTYVNPNIGFQIDLPTGWKGVEINFLINSVFAVPGETNLELLKEGGIGEDFQEPATFMTIMGIDQEGFNTLESIVSQFPALGGQGGAADGGGGQAGTSLPQGSSSDPLGTTSTMTPFGDSAVTCTFSQPSFVTINGINSEERMGECTDGGGGGGEGETNAKTKSYAFATQDNSLIVLGFYSNSTGTYDQNLPLFEESVRTISISLPADIATSDIYNRYKELVELQLSNQTSGGM
jgi:hypothetical protein